VSRAWRAYSGRRDSVVPCPYQGNHRYHRSIQILYYRSCIPARRFSSTANSHHSYSPTLFHAVGRVLGEVDLAAIPIGSYEPRWHLHLQHTDPEGAVRMAMQMNAKRSVGVHWGTWMMSDEPCEWVGSIRSGLVRTARYPLSVIHYPLLVARCSLLVARCSLPAHPPTRPLARSLRLNWSGPHIWILGSSVRDVGRYLITRPQTISPPWTSISRGRSCRSTRRRSRFCRWARPWWWSRK
jgi:hypothetical protein